MNSISYPDNLVPLIDLDIVTYRSGFACKDDEPVENALHNVKMALHQILDKFPAAPGYRGFLTGKGNFRFDVATIKPYKGNRKPEDKPKYYEDIRRYLVENWKAEVVDGIEADDAMGCEQWKNKDKSTVIVTIDKDLLMIPGWHFNYVKDIVRYVTIDEANLFFFKQMLTGDTTDNIPGVPKIGPKTADKLLDDLKGDTKALADTVYKAYQDSYGSTSLSAFNENAQLLWIRREENEDCPFLLL